MCIREQKKIKKAGISQHVIIASKSSLLDEHLIDTDYDAESKE